MWLRLLLVPVVTLAIDAVAGPTFEGFPISEEIAGVGLFQGGKFIFPNEIQADVWKPVLQNKKGVYIGVGTLRVLNTAVYNDFDQVFMLDVDGGVTQFNRVVLGLIRECETKEELLSYLTGWKITRDGREPWPNLPTEYWHKLPSPLREQYEQAFMREDFRAVFRSGPELRALREGEWQAGKATFKGSGTNKNTITVSDELYAVARRQVLANRFTVVQGSVTGLESMRDIAIALHKKGLQVSALDLSNVVDYLSGYQPLLANLNLLPFAPDAVVLHTLPDESLRFVVNPNKVKSDMWVYHASRVSRFREQLERAMRTPDDPFSEDRPRDVLHRELKETSAKLPNGLHVAHDDPCLRLLRESMRKGLEK